MKKLLLALFAFSALYMAGCKTESGDPKAVLISFFDAMVKKDIAAARKLATADSKGTFDLMEMGLKMAENTADDMNKEQFDKTNMEIAEAKIDGDRATVNVKEIKSGESVDFVLKKEGGSWKVAMDMETMMSMGADKMQEKGMSDEDMKKMNEAMEKMKTMSPDSIRMMMEKGKEAMEKNMQMLDSMKEKMNQ